MTKIDKIPPKEENTAGQLSIDQLIEPQQVQEEKRPVYTKRPTLHLILIGMMFAMVIMGMVILYSVSGPTGYSNFGNSAYYVRQQAIFTGIGLLLIFILSRFKIDFFNKKPFMIAAYLFCLVLIIITSLFGVEHNGARRWLKLGVEVQTSELLKFGLVYCYAVYRSMLEKMRAEGKLRAKDPKKQGLKDFLLDFILPGGLLALPDLFVAMQPHVSCAVIIAVVVFSLFFVSGIKRSSWARFIMFIIVPIGLVVGLLMVSQGFRDGLLNVVPDSFKDNFEHITKRMALFTGNDEELTSDDTQQVDRAQYALGSGGFWGVGIGSSRSKYAYVSEAHNDYIYSIFIEETGFVGGVAILIVYLVFFTMGMAVVTRGHNTYCRIMAMGPTMVITFEALWNMCVQLQISPTTGVTLPFVSYGGMAQLCLLINFGILISVAKSGIEPEVIRKNGDKK